MKKLNYCLWIPLFCAFSTFAQPSPGKDITGTIINERGEPLVNANVSIKNSRGTITNARGQFLLKNVTPDDILQISFVGYSSQLVAIKDQSVFNIVLKQAENELDRVVVQGYGITSKRLATGNIGTVSAREIAKHPITNPIRIIQGIVPGALVTNGNGSSSSSVKIEIRGRNTIDPTMVSEPLYIVDGVPMTILNLSNDRIKSYVGGSVVSQGSIQSGLPSRAGIGQSPFYGINPNDIESIEVLKDADATAIYGSRAANGVIIITTKKAKAGKTRTEINAFTGISQVPRYYKLLNTPQYIEMRKEAMKNDGLPINMQTAPDLVLWDTTRYTDWQHYLWGGNGLRSSFSANLSGGDARTSFRASAGYDFDKDIVTERGGNKRGSFSLNVAHKSLNQKFSFTWSALYSITSIDATNRTGSVLLPPNAPPIFDNNGKLNYSAWGNSSFPFQSLLQTYLSKTNFLNSNIKLSYEILKGIEIGANFGYNNSQNDQINKIPIASLNPANNPTGSISLGHTYFRNIIIEPQIQYSSFINKGKFFVLIGGTVQTNSTDASLSSGTNYKNDLLLNSINNAPTKSLSVYQGQYKYSGIFTRINYNWLNKYIFNLNARRDGSSRFGEGRQFGNFGSAGVAWIFSEEKILQKSKLLSFGKLRMSYGTVGSDQIVDYAYLSLWQFGALNGSTGTYNSNIPIVPLGFSDSLLQWEVNRKLELSISLGFFKDRILLEPSFYRNRCNNQLVSLPTPGFSGFTLVTSNLPANVQNTGIEIILSTKIFDNNTFKWELKNSFAINKNKLLDYPHLSQSPFKDRLIIGKPLNIGLYMKYIGVDPQTGLYQFEDVNKNGIVNDLDTYPVILSPKFDGGITNNVSYKNWSLSIFFYYRKQIGNNILASSNYAGTMSNQSLEILRRWQKPGDITDVGKLTSTGNSSYNYFLNYADSKVSDASYIRLQNFSVSYQFPDLLKKQMGLTKLKIYLQGENLFIITKYRGIDPEVQTLGAMPYPRIITAGLSCNF